MTTTNDTPRIYAASLAHYNSGDLVGEWFDVDESLPERVQEYISNLVCEGQKCEEWAIHDYEGFYGAKIGEYQPLSDIVELAEMIEEFGEAWIAFRDHIGEEYATKDGFEEAYCGEFKDEEEYAYSVVEDCGYLDHMPENLRYYFDYEKFSRDLFCGDYYSVDCSTGGVFVFRSI